MRNRAYALLALVTSLWLCACATGEWPAYRHDGQRTGTLPFGSPLSDPTNVKSLIVTRTFSPTEGGMFRASPVVSNGVVYIGSTNGYLYALDGNDLHQLWRYPTEGGGLVGSCNFGAYGIQSSAVVSGLMLGVGGKTVVIFGAPDPTAETGMGSARLFVLDAATGELLWKSAVVAHVTGCTAQADNELHERIAYSSPLLWEDKLYVGVHDSGDDPIQKGKVVAVNVFTHDLSPFLFVAAGTPADNTRGGGVWNSVAADLQGTIFTGLTTNLYFTTGNTREPPCWWPYDNANGSCPAVTEPAPNFGLSMLSVNKDSGAVNWQFQPVPFSRDGDPDWAAGASVVAASCGELLVSVMKDGWAYAVNANDGTCRWQFPATAGPGCVFDPKTSTRHGDDDYKQPVASFGDIIVMKAGGEPLIDQGVSDGYSRLYAVSACGDNRVWWRTDKLVTNAANPGYALGAPTMNQRVTFVTTSTGHLIAIGDPHALDVTDYGCSNPYFSAFDCPTGSQVVPIAPVLADVPLPDLGDAVGLRMEPVIANGKVYVATGKEGGGHVYALERAPLPPGVSFDITVGMTEFTGPRVCVRGTGFTGNGAVKLTYTDIPRHPGPIDGAGKSASSDGTFNMVDLSQESHWVTTNCTNDEGQQNVTIKALDGLTGRNVSAVVPGAYWCTNIAVATNYHGGCN